MTIDELRKSGLILFEAVVGSRAYGLATASSDTDIRGVFYLPVEDYLGGQYIAQVANASNDEVYYELGRFVELLSKSNPNILELLASPAIASYTKIQ
ncbi:DNA polymerase beta superfamily protein [Sphingobacterium puteale]|uniref:DNA polymerase beta superfamily protein n=1 Tax=Sphingobacterium puteale TaxID=2420510 RepID=UPI001FEBA7D7|nr:nucleotidyltransferase domain-containing protein [Sphingobacterium puteale]